MRSLARLLGRFGRDEQGNMAMLFSVAFVLSSFAAAFAVDEVSLYNERRGAQRHVDLAAIAAATNPADGFAIAQGLLEDAGLIPRGLSRAALSAAGARPQLLVVPGRYTGSEAVSPGDRFVANATPYNAAEVVFHDEGTLYFGATFGAAPPTIGVRALAKSDPQVAFSMGSRLASLGGGAANQILNQLLGANVALTVADYNALAGAEVNLFGFLDAIEQNLALEAVSYEDILAAEVDHGDLADALVDVLTGAEQLAAQTIANRIGHNGTFTLADLFALGAYGSMAAGTGNATSIASGLSVLEILSASAVLADGDRQVDIGSGINLGGLANTQLSLTIGEPLQASPWFTIDGSGQVMRTAQIRVKITTDVLGQWPLSVIRLPLYVEVANAEASPVSATCPTEDGASGGATIAARPGVARVALGEISNSVFSNFGVAPVPSQASLVNVLGLIRVKAKGDIEVGSTGSTALGFSPAEIAAGTAKTAESEELVASLTGSLLGSLDVDVEILSLLGIGLSELGVTQLLNAILTPVTPTLDALIAGTLDVVGLNVGEVDVRVYGARCTQSVLVG